MKRRALGILMGLVLVVLISMPAIAGGAPEVAAVTDDQPHWTVDGFDYDALVAAAQAEGTVTIRWHSGRAPRAAEAFEAKYGIRTIATPRFDDSENIERLRREHEARNVQADVLGMDDGAVIITEFIPRGMVTSWTPPDLATLIPEAAQDPQVYLYQPVVFGFNSNIYDRSPISNLWELTEPQWAGRFAFADPPIQPYMWHFFAGIIAHADAMEAAYRAHYGRPIVLTEENAGWEWVVRVFKNNPLAVRHDTDVAKAVGAPGQSTPPIGLYTLTRFRDAQEQELHLGFDPGIEPFAGFALPTYAVIPTNAPNPNAARLWVRFVLTEEGHFPWSGVIGGFSPNQTVQPAENPLGTWDQWQDVLMLFDPVQSAEVRRDLIDLWLTHAQ